MVRSATVADIPWLLEQLREFADFFGTKRSLFTSDTNVAAIIEPLITSQVFFVAERDGVPLGFIAGSLTPHPFNPAIRVLSEVFWWVDPEHRGSSVGARLFEVFVDYGRHHADWIVMTLEAGSPVAGESIERRGFRLHERSYLLEVELHDATGVAG